MQRTFPTHRSLPRGKGLTGLCNTEPMPVPVCTRSEGEGRVDSGFPDTFWSFKTTKPSVFHVNSMFRSPWELTYNSSLTDIWSAVQMRNTFNVQVSTCTQLRSCSRCISKLAPNLLLGVFDSFHTVFTLCSLIIYSSLYQTRPVFTWLLSTGCWIQFGNSHILWLIKIDIFPNK